MRVVFDATIKAQAKTPKLLPKLNFTAHSTQVRCKTKLHTTQGETKSIANIGEKIYELVPHDLANVLN